jgi:hypothetical protein
MGQAEPPLSSTSLFYIGRDSHGRWVVQDQKHLCGGLFVDRAAALKFALFENGHRPQAVIMVPGLFELDTGTSRDDVYQPAVSNDAPPQRQAA